MPKADECEQRWPKRLVFNYKQTRAEVINLKHRHLWGWLTHTDSPPSLPTTSPPTHTHTPCVFPQTHLLSSAALKSVNYRGTWGVVYILCRLQRHPHTLEMKDTAASALSSAWEAVTTSWSPPERSSWAWRLQPEDSLASTAATTYTHTHWYKCTVP